jgi:hypothetical protein
MPARHRSGRTPTASSGKTPSPAHAQSPEHALWLEIKRHEVDVDAPYSSDGLLQINTFDDFLLGQSAAQNGSPIGASNVTESMGSSGLFRKDERYTDLAAFVQDDIKLTQAADCQRRPAL